MPAMQTGPTLVLMHNPQASDCLDRGGAAMVAAQTACCEMHAAVQMQMSLALTNPSGLSVPHVRQLYNWDCGLACVLMVLRALGVTGCDLASLQAGCQTTSIWTVDLAHLLRRFGAQVVLTTITIGANPEYASETFYAENMEEDEARVERLFREAPMRGIPVQRRSLAAQELQAHLLSGDWLLIALVDKRKLGGSWSPAASDPLCIDCFPLSNGYTGHYIVICGYCCQTDMFSIRDPASMQQNVTVSTATLEAARRAYGTDEDLLLISTEKPTNFFQGISMQ